MTPYIIAREPKINVADSWGYTALTRAIENGNNEVTSKLLQRKASIAYNQCENANAFKFILLKKNNIIFKQVLDHISTVRSSFLFTLLLNNLFLGNVEKTWLQLNTEMQETLLTTLKNLPAEAGNDYPYDKATILADLYDLTQDEAFKTFQGKKPHY